MKSCSCLVIVMVGSYDNMLWLIVVFEWVLVEYKIEVGEWLFGMF